MAKKFPLASLNFIKKILTKNMKNEIKRLERSAKLLEVNAHRRKRDRNNVISYTEKFLDTLSTIPAFAETKTYGKELYNEKIKETGINIKKVLKIVSKNIDNVSLNPASGGHLGYIPGGGIYYSALGDYMAAITNRYSGIFYASPGAVRMENMLVKWMAKLVNYPSSAAGTLLSGGSIANLTAIVTAREAHKIKASVINKTVVYLTQHAHHCIGKALRIAGLDECIIRQIPMDVNYKMDAIELENQINSDIQSGYKPWLIIASAGTTDVGAIDPLNKIGAIAKKHSLWFHVDAAYGGFFTLTKKGKQKLKGISLSDSIVMDPHKGLFLPYGIGVVIVKNKKYLQDSFQYTANYMQDAIHNNDEISPANLSPELTRHFRGLRMWLPLMLHGVKPFRACLDEKLLLAQYFYNEIKKLGFETGPKPELTVVTYRYVPKTGDANKFNEELVKAVQHDGRVFISSTTINGIYMLRFACLSFRTHLQTVNTLLDILAKHTKNS